MAQDLELFLHQAQAGDLLRFPGPGSFIHEIYLQQLLTQAGFEAEFERVVKQLPGWVEIWRHEGSLITDNSPNGREPYFCRPEFKKVATWIAEPKRKHKWVESPLNDRCYCKECGVEAILMWDKTDCPGAPEQPRGVAAIKGAPSGYFNTPEKKEESATEKALKLHGFDESSGLAKIADAIKADLRKEFIK